MLAFVHIHKTAGTTLDDILARSFGLRHCYLPPVSGKTTLSADDLRRVQKLYPPLASIAGHYVTANSGLEKARPDIRYYTFLRDPLVRCASHYQYQIQEQGQTYSFDSWIGRNVKRNPQTVRIAGPNGTAKDAIELLKNRFMFVGLVEHFDESLVIFRKLLGDSRLALWYRRKRVAPKDEIKNRLLSDPKTREQMIEANQLDIELYEFASKELYPAFKGKYNGELEKDVDDFQRTNESTTGLRPKLNMLANRYISRRVIRLKHAMAYYR